jgi:hypothetical protein
MDVRAVCILANPVLDSAKEVDQVKREREEEIKIAEEGKKKKQERG